MKRIIVLSLILCSFYHVSSQDCCDRLIKQGVEIDSLKKVIKTLEENCLKERNDRMTIIKANLDTIQTLKSEISKFDKFKAEKFDIDNQLKLKNDTITTLKNLVLEKSNQISLEKQNCERRTQEEKEKGRNDALSDFINSYKEKSFDDLINTSTKQSVQRDMHLIGNNSEVKQVLADLDKYFRAEELLTMKFDPAQIKNAQIQLDQIKRQSASPLKLKDDIAIYKDYYNDLKVALEKLIELDEKYTAGDDVKIKEMKFCKISLVLSKYFYNYYDYGNYPYLSDIVIQIMKRKYNNADADITDLLIRLN